MYVRLLHMDFLYGNGRHKVRYGGALTGYEHLFVMMLHVFYDGYNVELPGPDFKAVYSASCDRVVVRPFHDPNGARIYATPFGCGIQRVSSSSEIVI